MVSKNSFWMDDPNVLIKEFVILPATQMTLEEKANSGARLIIACSVIAFIAFQRPTILITGIACLFALGLMTKHLAKEAVRDKLIKQGKEGFQNLESEDLDECEFTQPTSKNPLMNVLLPEIGSRSDRPPAAPAYNAIVETDINAKTQKSTMKEFGDNPNIDQRLFKEVGDSLAFDRSMISFNTTANTQIPNDQEGFAKFCYGNMPSGKTGSKEGLLSSIKPRVIDGVQ